jgi:hypothetical protein
MWLKLLAAFAKFTIKIIIIPKSFPLHVGCLTAKQIH